LERGVHVQHRADALALDLQGRELELPLLDLVHVDLHLQATEAEWDLDVRRPAPVVVDVERLDARHRLRERGRVVQDVPDRAARRLERALARDIHVPTPVTRAPASAGLFSISHTRWYGFALSHTLAPPRPRSASCTAAHTAWMPAPPPSPIPF